MSDYITFYDHSETLDNGILSSICLTVFLKNPVVKDLRYIDLGHFARVLLAFTTDDICTNYLLGFIAGMNYQNDNN